MIFFSFLVLSVYPSFWHYILLIFCLLIYVINSKSSVVIYVTFQIDIQLETGEYFLNNKRKSAKIWQEKQEKQAEKTAENKRKRDEAFIPPKVYTNISFAIFSSIHHYLLCLGLHLPSILFPIHKCCYYAIVQMNIWGCIRNCEPNMHYFLLNCFTL